jgi:hypothetical protein
MSQMIRIFPIFIVIVILIVILIASKNDASVLATLPRHGVCFSQFLEY